MSLKAFAFLTLMVAMAVLMDSCATTEKPNGQVPTTLVIGLDGISYATFKKMQDGGHFRNFLPVSQMVATFPSISDPNWTQIFQLKAEKGYTKAYFDPEMKKSNGGLTSHLARQPHYEDVMDFKLDGMFEHLSSFIWTETTALYWLESLEEKFFEFRGRDTYFAFILNTDLISHTVGEQRILKYLAFMEKRIEHIQDRYKKQFGRELEIVLISDHGNAFFEPQDLPFEKELEKMGWNITDTVKEPNDVGFYVPEILSFGAFYTPKDKVSDFAKSLAKVSHIQSVMYESGPGEIRLLSGSNSEARITVDLKARLVDYRVLKGKDPLINQAQYFKQGPLPFEDYFLKTLDETYPNAAMRIWEGFHVNSQIKPSVLANPELGFVFGNKALRMIVDIRGFASSHGSLHKDETFGLFVSTTKQLPPVRPQDVGRYINLSHFKNKSPEPVQTAVAP